MNLRQKRNETSKAILEGRFIRLVLTDESRALDSDIENQMAAGGFQSALWKDKSFTVIGGGNNLEYRHKKAMRFVDMKTRQTSTGKIFKKNHPIHNRKVFGHLNNIARDLSFGFTDAVIEDMKKIEE